MTVDLILLRFQLWHTKKKKYKRNKKTHTDDYSCPYASVKLVAKLVYRAPRVQRPCPSQASNPTCGPFLSL